LLTDAVARQLAPVSETSTGPISANSLRSKVALMTLSIGGILDAYICLVKPCSIVLNLYAEKNPMSVNPDLLAPCGLYCGACSIRYADHHDDEKLKEKLASLYGLKTESIKCNGCMSNKRISFCQSCGIRSCVQGKKISGCHQCRQFPCSNITNFPFKHAVQFMLQSTSYRKGKTDAQWAKWEEDNWKCRSCGAPTFRGARRCPKCKTDLVLVLE
jgi:hypothetical protein